MMYIVNTKSSLTRIRSRKDQPSGTEGFVLVITVALMLLLALLAVGLLSLSTITLRNSAADSAASGGAGERANGLDDRDR